MIAWLHLHLQITNRSTRKQHHKTKEKNSCYSCTLPLVIHCVNFYCTAELAKDEKSYFEVPATSSQPILVCTSIVSV